MDEILLGVIWYAVLLFSLTFHEAGHAWAALRGGDLTAYRGGQVSLDPMPHIRREPFGTVFMPLLSYALWGWMMGWASAPYDPRWAYEHPRRAAWMALAGPGSNLLLVVAAGFAIRFGIMAEVFYPPPVAHFTQIVAAVTPGVWETAATLLSIAFTLNLLLCVFNLFPLPPLDGAAAIGVLVSEDAARRWQAWMAQPHFARFGIQLAWFAIVAVFSPIHRLALNLLYPEYSYG